MDGFEETKLIFSDELEQDNLMALEVTEDILKEIMDSSGQVMLRGRTDDKAVLVTESKTYQVRLVESTNCMMMIPPGGAAHDEEDPEGPSKKQKTTTNTRTISGLVSCHYELNEMNAPVKTLRDLLQPRPYTAEEDELHCAGGAQSAEDGSESQVGSGVDALYSTHTLRKVFQASDTQLYETLSLIGAVELSGKWRLLDPDFSEGVFDLIMNTVLEHDYPMDAVPAPDIIAELENDVSAPVAMHVLRSYSLPRTPADAADAYTLDLPKICVFRALQLFADKNPYPHDEFMSQWVDICPYGANPHTDMLKGYALSNACIPTSTNASGTQWTYFAVSALTSDVRGRFKQLFGQKTQWSLEAIEPYIKDLPEPGTALDKFLMKNARVVNTKDGVVYTKRY